MSELQLQQHEVVTAESRTVQLEYDVEGDMLEIFVERGPTSSAIELADPIILRFDRETGRTLSLSTLTFSRVTQPTELGPRSFPLSGLESLPGTVREQVARMITPPPVSHFLKVWPTIPRRSSPLSRSVTSSGRWDSLWPLEHAGCA